jgi:6-phosphogluconate dehydrogenase
VTQIGFVGLGKMGANMVHRICRDSEHEVVAFDSDRDAVKRVVKDGAIGVGALTDLVKELRGPRIVWLMLPAGEVTQRTIDRLAKLLRRDDTIVDGGNSKWTDDKRRAAELKKAGIHYVDVGTSGGVWGLEVGYCMMVGGPNKAVARLAPILDVLAPETNEVSREAIGPRGWMHFGPAGAGHFVKMVHNGVEYGLMQAYAEGFDLFDKCEYELDNAKIAHLWGQGSVVRSWLCELAARAFEADGNDLHALTGYTEDSGEGRWTIAEATERDVPTPVITASLYARLYSRGNGDYTHRVLAALRNQFGGHAVQSTAKTAAKPAQGKSVKAKAAKSKPAAATPAKAKAARIQAPAARAAKGRASR